MMRGREFVSAWNVPYIVAWIHSGKHRVSLYSFCDAVIGVVSESI